ncbi:competence protein CoiA, partial [Salmonella enterica subsp. enterica serovar Typhimurium]|nr:competence protein CoiA [Salmonella enterica subsp. enterica serovar Typhimurium]
MKLPIAINKTTNELVNAKDVPNGLACDCFCPGCGEDLIAVNEGKVKGPHFRHTTSNCSIGGNYESYIHWLSKEVFKHLDSITLPPIIFADVERSLPSNRN